MGCGFPQGVNLERIRLEKFLQEFTYRRTVRADVGYPFHHLH